MIITFVSCSQKLSANLLYLQIEYEDDDVEWLEDFDNHDQKELETETENYIKEASAFYDREIARYEHD